MQVNSERWGTSDTWIDYNANADIKHPSYAKSNYALAYGLDTNTPDETMHTNIDLSIAPWGINKNSLLNKRYYVAPWIDGDDNLCDLVPINEDDLDKSKPLIINGRMRMRNSSGGTFSPDSIIDGNASLRNNYNPNYPQFSSVSTYTNWAVNNVIVNFNYHKIVLLPQIICSPGTEVNDTNVFNYSSYYYCTFDEFITNYDSTIKGKKVVRGIRWIEYLGNNGARTANNSEYSMQFTIPYKVPARPSFSDMSYNNTRFPTVDMDTMLSTNADIFNQYHCACMGSFVASRVDWLRWWNAATTAERSINWWSGANSNGTNYDRRTIMYDDSIFEWYFQPYVSGQNRNGATIIRTENRTAQEIVDYFAKQMAYLGFMFAWNETDATSAIIGENNSICIPTFDSGITTGNYTRGTENVNNPAFLWRDDVWERNNYDPNPGPGGNTPWDDNPITRIQEGYWTGFGGKTYISSMDSFSTALDSVKSRLDQNLNSFWDQAKDAADAYAADLANEAKRTQFLKGFEDLVNNNSVNNAIVSNSPNTNYTDCFLSCIRYPFDITNYFSREGTDTGITWGRYLIISATGTWKVNGYNTGQIVQGGSLYVEKKYDNFLNYAPYTTAELYIPYCGSIPIDLEVFAGHTIDVKYLIDWFSGSCLALIYRDSVVVDQIPGQIGTSVGIVAEDIQSYQNAMFNGSQTLKAQKNSLKSSIVGAMGQSMDQISGAIGNVATAVLGGEPSSSGSQSGGGAFAKGFNVGTGVAQNYQNVKTAKYNLDHTYIDFKQLGSNGPSVGSWNEQVCRLVLYYPTFLPEYNPSEYGHTVGFACLFNKTLSNFSGLTVCSSVDTSGLTGATESEKTLIEDALKSGVYL